MKSLFAVGLMTGTSLDGVDVALVKLTGEGFETQCELLHFLALPLEETLKEEIQIACDHTRASVALICSLNMKLGQLYSDSVTALLAEVARLQKEDKTLFKEFSGKLDFIASHGQTIYHLPHKNAEAEGLTPSTLQIGDPSIMAYQHKTDIYFNFRMMDIAAGGDGAPLVPLTELILYRDSRKNRLLQNIGGIGNVTVLPKNAGINEVWAFDTGPGNMMINDAMMHYFQKPFDNHGEIAGKGQIIPALFTQLKAHAYLAEKPPKSTGREIFGANYTLPLLAQFAAEKSEDVIHTLTRFTAFTIAESYRQFIMPQLKIDEVIIGGGGAYNTSLLTYLRAELPGTTILTNEDIGISSDAKEAIAFALLGHQTRCRKIGNVPGATGARESVVLGQICPNPFPASFD